MVQLPLMPLLGRVIVDLRHQKSLEAEQAMQVVEGSNNDVAGASQAMREFRAMCRAIFRRERYRANYRCNFPSVLRRDALPAVSRARPDR
jgi:hypothetical protein